MLIGRIARNAYFWMLILYLAFGLNRGNEPLYHYGIIYSSWYLPVIFTCLLFQWILVYTNNLWLVPRFLAKRRWLTYGCLATLLGLSVAALYVVLFTISKPHLNVEEIQHPGFVDTYISAKWSVATFVSETFNFFTSSLMWLAVFTMAWFMNDYARQQRALKQSEQLRVQTELAFLKNQINPHFLFNTLNNIYGLTLSKSDAAPEVVLKLSSLLRYLLYESNTPTIQFQKEQAAIEAYVEIEALRLPDDAVIRLQVHADHDYAIPPLLWIGLLENAFKHGTQLIDIPISVACSFRIEKDVLTITTHNNCIAGDSNSIAEGIGLVNLRKRLELLYAGHYALELDKTGQIFSATLTVQLT